MNSPGSRLVQVRALVEDESVEPGDQPGAVGQMQRLCRAAARALTATGVGISLITESDDQVTVAASGTLTEQVEGLQLALGEGPSLEARATRRPVLVSDLGEGGARWPVYASAAQAYGVRAVFAFPMQIGAARLGAMGVYRRAVGGLSDDHLAQALTFAEVGTADLLDSLPPPGGGPNRVVQDAVDNRYEVFQAQGMVTVQLGVSLVEAMARMRAHAFAQDRLLKDVAHDILAGRIVLEPDEP